MQSKPVLILLAVVLVLFAWKVIGLTGKLQETYKNKKIEQEKIADLEARKTKLSSDIEKLGTDKGKEEVIRENFGFVKEGEQVIVVVDEKNKTAIQVQPKKGFLGWFKNLFNIK